MKSGNSLTYQVSSLSTGAVQTLAHAFSAHGFCFTKWKSTGIPAKFFISNPSLLSRGGGYPYSGNTLGMRDTQTPFSFQRQNICVGNGFGSKRIENLNYILFQNHLGFYPGQIHYVRQNYTNKHLKKNLSNTFGNPKTVHNKKSNQNIGTAGPNKITSGSECVLHSLSIAGETA